MLQKSNETFIRFIRIALLLPAFINVHVYAQLKSPSVFYHAENLQFEWNIEKDSAKVLFLPNNSVVWRGSLLPSFWVASGNKKFFLHASSVSLAKTKNANETRVFFQLENYGEGRMLISTEPWGIRFRELEVDWKNQVPQIISMFFGTRFINDETNLVWPTTDKPFLADWQAEGFCVPGAKEGTAQSYFRSWDFGQSNIALGSFGPSTGSLYAAAYPRPLYYAGMGNDQGFIVIGAGSIPDAAMSLRVQSSLGCFEFVYNEDIWGSPSAKKRIWEEPLRLSIAENAWMSFRKYYSSFPDKKTVSKYAAVPAWNTWGMFKDRMYVIGPVAEIAKKANAGLVVIDGSWESATGTGRSNKKLFPHFDEDVDSILKSGMAFGLWQSVGWIENPFEEGLTINDLIINRNGKPCKANWNFDPWNESYYCLDPSSEKARAFLTNRTIAIMKKLKPKLLKLDFGYGLPAPFMGVPRNTAFRGERYAYELVKIIHDAAKSIDPDVAIMYYSISPLWQQQTDIVSLDDQGDLWYDVPNGHSEWSIWASLLSDRNTVLNGSSGYDWETDDEVILNTCILGAPGSVLSVYDKNHQYIPEKYLNRRLAINSWCRKSVNWSPLWLNSNAGNFSAPPQLNCWGRIEKKDADSLLTVLVLRDRNKSEIKNEQIRKMDWSGRWALIAQDANSVFSSPKLAIIPFDAGYISIPLSAKPSHLVQLSVEGRKDATTWQWENGILKIQVSNELLENIAGFEIE
jgi:hypothetical protein